MIKNDIRRSTETKNEDIKLVFAIVLFPIIITMNIAGKIICKLTYTTNEEKTKNAIMNKEVE
jgi:hypothetical protein